MSLVTRLSNEDVDSVLMQRRLVVDNKHILHEDGCAAVDYTQPMNTRDIARLCSLLSRWAMETGTNDVVLVFTDYGTWPTEEFHVIVQAVLLDDGDTRSLNEAPGLRFGLDQAGYLTDWLRLAMYSGWGGFLTSARNDFAACFTEDEWFGVVFRDRLMLKDRASELESQISLGAPLWSNVGD